MKSKVSILNKSIECFKVDEDYPVTAKYPNNMMIELTNACNLSCRMCNHKNMKRKTGFMSEELFNKIIEQAKELNIKNIGLYTVGESFLHPKIFDFIKTAKNKGIEYVYITTNGQPLDKDKIQKIFDSGLDSIKFSIDASSKEIYENIRIGGKWEKLVENIKLLRELRDKSGSKLRIFASFTITQDSHKDLPKYNSIFKDLIDETLFDFVSDQGGQQVEEFNSMMPEIIKKNLNKLILPREKWYPCNLLWNRFITTYDGKLTICCVDFEACLVYGDLDKNTLKECWNNEKMQVFRKIHKQGRFEALSLCNRCSAVKRDENMLNYLTSTVILN